MAHPLPDPLPAYAAFFEERERSPLSIETYLLDLRHFARWFDEANGEPWTPGRTTTTDLREFKQHLRVARKRRPATINRKLASLRSFLQWAHSSGRLGDRRLPRVPRTVRRERLGPRWLERRERLALLRAVERRGSERDIAILRLLLHTGGRVQELCDLAWSDVRLSSRKGRVLVRHGKGAKQREIPLNNFGAGGGVPPPRHPRLLIRADRGPGGAIYETRIARMPRFHTLSEVHLVRAVGFLTI
ncbi:MAG: site-specific integrase [bacterium]|nr:site-specific integrase [bacterium]